MNLPPIPMIFLAVATVTVPLDAETTPVAFDWFEYSGTNVLETRIGPGEYQNPILTGFYPDPSICRVGDDFYLISSTFAYFPGIPFFHSRDLVNWEQISHVIHRPDQLRYDRVGVSGGIFAPAISHHEGVFYVVCTQVGGNDNFVGASSIAEMLLQSRLGSVVDPLNPCAEVMLNRQLQRE